MARQIKIEQIDDLMKEAVQELVQKTTLQWTTLAKKATPVVTGNLRKGWKTNIWHTIFITRKLARKI